MTSSKPFHLITILPPYLVGDDKLAGLTTSDKMLISDISGQAHKDFNNTLLSSYADAVLIIVDGAFGLEKKSLWAKSLTCLAAIPDVIIAIDNMAMIDYSTKHFDVLCEEFSESTKEFNCRNLHIVPTDIASGENLHKSSANMSWYDGLPLIPLIEKQQQKQRAEPTREDSIRTSDQFAMHLCWLAPTPMIPGRQYVFDKDGQKFEAGISTLKHRLNPETMEHQAAKCLFAGNIGYGNISLETAIPFAPFEKDRKAGSFTLKDKESGETVAMGLIKHSLRRATNIRWQQVFVDKLARAKQKRQTPFVLWFTGLSGSGKSTIASLVEKQLHAMGHHTYLLDGDNVRHGLCRDLGFTEADRVENIRRIGEISKLMVDSGLIVITSFISPFRAERRMARELMDEGEFIEVFVDTPLVVCEERDIKGLYKKARAGQIANFTGIDSPYENPQNAEIHLDGTNTTAQELAEEMMERLKASKLLPVHAGHEI
ncbi:MAG: adenylyl-sulfate kinase [bacterium]|nr:adenylyl-sulfate kinase [bacterium]